MQALGDSNQSAERSAFDALASGDGIAAMNMLEAYAVELEGRGENKQAADVYTKIGAISLVVDLASGLPARRKAVLLDPNSLRAFQGLFLDTITIKDGQAGLDLATEALARPGLSDRMRAWVLAHRGLVETERLRDDVKARATMQEIETIYAKTNDVVALYGSHWVGALIARNNDRLVEALTHGEKARAILPTLPTPVLDFTTVSDIRILMQMGDERSALDLGLTVLDERASRGEFLPMPMIQQVCQAGIRVGEVARVAEHCRSVARNMAPSDPPLARAYLGLLAAALKDERTSASEFAAANALMEPDHLSRDTVWLFEGEAAAMRGDLADAEVLVNKAVARVREPGASRSPRSFIAGALRLLGGWKVAAGQKAEACAPLAEARQLYTEIGATPGRLAVEGLLMAAACPA